MNNSYNQYHNLQDIPQNNHIGMQPYQIGQPINQQQNYNSNLCNSNNYGYQYPQQQVELNQLYNQNPLVVVNTDANLINVQYSNPEIIYCSSPIRSNRKYGNDGVGVSGIINALQQIYSELNLVFPELDLIGQFNLLSTDKMESKVIQSIINNNRYISSEAIRNGKISFCCKSLQSMVIKYFYYLIILLTFIVISLSIGYQIYLQQSASWSQLIIPYSIQVLSFVLQTIVFFVIIVVSGFIEMNNNSHNSVGTRLAVQVPCMFMLMLSFMLYQVILASTRRLLILLKQLDQTEFIDGNCI
ncbi:transmembrane protein, putative (macronuclear) [Tetrahymena thermophila SB210]|uniref:Transmembrane protein, putative n=1 Tax=Tetrahymena thermophila (strain SB210) TaxID=312017 RepID=Q23JE9_TETTS|nr:transmembrane protein, putative [Tetrahymena thermophila SB210]EAR96555.2 transmembrane protein, putative [Tetrahymena thermophila SB210]|eukprot:XP_001016800.2 transmembrane protein, putative [Tetrahymena thermophila SB210]